MLGLWTENPKNTSIRSVVTLIQETKGREVNAAETLFTKGTESMVQGKLLGARGFFQRVSSSQRLQLALACLH